MAAPAAAPKRHRGNKLGERRGKGDAASSRDASEEGESAHQQAMSHQLNISFDLSRHDLLTEH